MDQPESEGVRLAALDGSDKRAVSQLLILDEFMRLVEWDTKSPTRILPCDYFDMMAGVGTGGIIIFLLVVLRMGIEEAIQEFLNIWEIVYADCSLDRVARSAKLEEVLKCLLQGKGIAVDRPFCTESQEDSRCKAFVCVASQSSMGLCEKFRTYKARETSKNPTIIEAIRATCAVSSLFTPVTLKASGWQQTYVTGAHSFNNPTWETIKEACEHFKGWRPVACMLSVGCGQRTFLVTEITTGREVSDEMTAVASDCELVDADLSWRIGKSGVYYRLSVDGLCQTNSQEDILACTNLYLARQTTKERMDGCVVAALRLGQRTLRDIAGLTEARLAVAYSLPPLSAFFLERPALIKRMAERLFRIGPPAQRIMVLSGLGGIGKTQSTISFLLHYLPRFRHVLFIDATSKSTIESSLRAKVKSLGECYARKTARDVLEVLERADQHITMEWAIVYDNLDDENIEIAEYLPHCHFGTIIITTRNRHLSILAPTAYLELDVMSEEESVEVLLRTAFATCNAAAAVDQTGAALSFSPTQEDKQCARDIVEELGYLPVALVQAGYYINVHNGLDTYLHLLRKRRPETLSSRALGQLDVHYHGVYATLDVTLPRLSPRAQNLLRILGCVNHAGFPIALFHRASLCSFLFEPVELMDRPAKHQKTIDLLNDTFRPRKDWEEQDVNEPLDELKKYYLVTCETTFMVNTLRIHPMVHSWIQDRLLEEGSEEDREVYPAASLRLLVCGSGPDEEDISEFIYPHAALVFDRLDELHVNDRAGIAAIYACQGDKRSVIIWEGVYRDVNATYGPEDCRTGEAKLQLAYSYGELNGDFRTLMAQTFEREVIELRMRTLGMDHPMTVMAIARLAGRMAECEQYRERGIGAQRNALAFWQSRHGDLEMVIQAKRALACTLLTQDSDNAINESITLFTEVMQARIKQKGPNHHATLKATEDLAHASSLLGGAASNSNTPPAISLWISIVDARTQSRGAQHTGTLDSLENLAWLYRCHHMFEMSVECWKQVIHLRKKAQGLSHKQTIRSMEVLALLYAEYKRYTEAEVLLKEILAMKETAQTPSYEDILRAMTELARVYEWSGQDLRAEVQWKDTIDLLTEVVGPNHECTVNAMEALAGSYCQSRRFRESEAQWKEVIDLRHAAQGADHKKTINAMARLADLYGQSERYADAERLWEEALARLEASHWLSHKEIIDTMAGLAATCAMSNRYTEAKRRWMEVIALRKEKQGPSHEDTSSSIAQLAILYGKCRQYEKAEALWNEAIWKPYTSWTIKEGTADNLAGLAEMYTQSHRYSEALEMWEIVANLKSSFRGRSHPNTLRMLAELANAYVRCKQYKDAEAQWVEVICLTKDMYGRIHRDTLKAAESLAELYAQHEDLANAQTQWELVVMLRKEAQGSYHEDTVRAMEQLTEVYGRVEWSEKGEALYKELIAAKSKLKGPHHQEMIDMVAELSRKYSYARRYHEAEAQWKVAIELSEMIHGFTHEKTLEFMGGLSAMYWECKRYDEAEAEWRNLISRRKEPRGTPSHGALDIMKRLRNAFMGCKWLQDAETEWKEAICLGGDSRGIIHQDPTDSMKRLASMYADQCNRAKVQWEEGAGKVPGLSDRRTNEEFDSMIQVAMILISCKWYSAVEALGREMIFMWRGIQPHKKPYALYTMERLALLYEEYGRYDDARKWYIRSRPCTCREHCGDGPTPVASTQRRNIALTVVEKWPISASQAGISSNRIGSSGPLAKHPPSTPPFHHIDSRQSRKLLSSLIPSSFSITSPFEDH